MKLYNTASRKLESFLPLNPSEVKVYTCGPTVYNFQHIGNFAAQIYWDLLVRTLIANGYMVKRIVNLTDVGHLVSDGDDGEDKLEKGAAREGKDVWEIAQLYIDDFLEKWRLLKLLPPAKFCRATDYIEADKKLVNLLLDGGYAYETSDGIYFDTSKFPDYADFARLDLGKLQVGARVEFNPEKRNISDFAVWKFIKPNEKHAMRWDFWGRPGYPGWHLECSVIIHEELGEPIDIHCGGIDHIPVHHTNEIAQSEAAFGIKLSEKWLHCNFITSEGQKISKSLGNGYLIDDIAARGFSPMDYKMWVLQGHYRKERDFSFDDLAVAASRRLKYRNRLATCYQTISGPVATGVEAETTGTTGVAAAAAVETKAARPTAAGEDKLEQIIAALSDDLNSPLALTVLDSAENTDLEFWQKVDELFGLGLIEDTPDIEDGLKNILAKRAAARAVKDWAKSDALRAELEKAGITVKDTPTGQIWQYLR